MRRRARGTTAPGLMVPWPGPAIDLRLVDAIFVGVGLAFELHHAQLFFCVSAGCTQGGHAIDCVHSDGEAINLVPDSQVERRVDVAFFFVAADMQILMVGAAVREPVDEPRITVKIEDDRFVGGKETVEVSIAQTVWMLPV